jgi:CRISPR-associated protein Csb2
VEGGELAVEEDAERALQWLEEHPPDALRLPRVVRNRGSGIAYRDLGLLERRPSKPLKSKRLARPATESVALGGAVAWIWEDEPPGEVRVALERLCPDVSHLGGAESPVRLRVGEADSTHRRDDGADLFGGRGVDLAVPTRGRTEELEALEGTRRKPPRPRTDRFTANENELPAPGEHRHVATARFRSISTGEPDLPWSTVLMVPLDTEIGPAWRVRWAIHAHRALIRLVGPGAPALLTGAYPEGALRPANRVAIHLLGRETLAERTLETPSTLAVLLPTDATAADTEVIARATAQLSRLTGPGGRVARRGGEPFALDGGTFWPEPSPGRIRRWLTVPAAVPDTRPPRRDAWTMEDAIALSVGLVWRDHLETGERGLRWQIGLATEAKAKGVRAEQVRMVTQGDPTRFVHRVNPGAVVRPYQAVLDLGTLGSTQGLVAIGQARHLGGGLLYPIDVAATSEEAL